MDLHSLDGRSNCAHKGGVAQGKGPRGARGARGGKEAGGNGNGGDGGNGGDEGKNGGGGRGAEKKERRRVHYEHGNKERADGAHTPADMQAEPDRKGLSCERDYLILFRSRSPSSSSVVSPLFLFCWPRCSVAPGASNAAYASFRVFCCNSATCVEVFTARCPASLEGSQQRQ